MDEQDDDRGARPPENPPDKPEESAPEGSTTEEDSGIDAAKLSDEEATLAARAFLGTAEPDEEVSVDEAKNMLRRAGAVAEAEPEVEAPAPEPEPERPSAATPPRSRRSTPAAAGMSSTPTRGTRTR